jgi:hypothetical protein
MFSLTSATNTIVLYERNKETYEANGVECWSMLFTLDIDCAIRKLATHVTIYRQLRLNPYQLLTECSHYTRTKIYFRAGVSR